jgi:deazaflavin-dependent oxidoreductase (nitroreductase family)
VLHRAIYRFSGSQIGLSRPEAGRRFGMLRLTTLGRRSGQPRVAIVGYYEDGPNLVTLAMNGWADAEPAWWLNLQAQPDTTVDLADGPRTVRARAAAGAERERLWASFRDYPGWGDDIDALAARRSTKTAVVVLEPRTTYSPIQPESRVVMRLLRELSRRKLRTTLTIVGITIGVWALVVFSSLANQINGLVGMGSDVERPAIAGLEAGAGR